MKKDKYQQKIDTETINYQPGNKTFATKMTKTEEVQISQFPGSSKIEALNDPNIKKIECRLPSYQLEYGKYQD